MAPVFAVQSTAESVIDKLLSLALTSVPNIHGASKYLICISIWIEYLKCRAEINTKGFENWREFKNFFLTFGIEVTGFISARHLWN